MIPKVIQRCGKYDWNREHMAGKDSGKLNEHTGSSSMTLALTPCVLAMIITFRYFRWFSDTIIG